MANDNIGTEEGSVCGRNGCTGTLGYTKPENCSCHLSAPCSSCMDTYLECEGCGATPEEEE